MKFSSGCLAGLLVGIALSVVVYLGYMAVFSSDNLPLSPAYGASNPDLTITMTEQYLNDQLSKGLSLRGLKVSDLAIRLHASNRAEATMTMPIAVSGQTFAVRPHASFHFGISNKTITFDVDNVDISGVTVPQALLDQQMGAFQQYASSQVNAALGRSLANTGLHVVGVESAEGSLTVQLSR